jgi:Uma2 family endonuclease
MLLELKRINVPPGQKIFVTDVNWQEFEDILEDLGEHRHSKIAYNNNILEIMAPLPEHEREKEVISDFVKALLEELDMEFLTLGSTTFKNRKMMQGIEPDNCFYIENEALIRDKDRLDLSIDPPPDLALEIDVTSRTYSNLYKVLGVPELWRFEKGNLQINLLKEGEYIESEFSEIFGDLSIKKELPKFVNQVKEIGRNKTMKIFRNWVKQQKSS